MISVLDRWRRASGQAFVKLRTWLTADLVGFKLWKQQKQSQRWRIMKVMQDGFRDVPVMLTLIKQEAKRCGSCVEPTG